MTDRNKIKTSARYAKVGRTFGGIVGGVGATVYVISPLNPSKGLLSLKQDIMIFVSVFIAVLVGSGLGYIFGKWIAGRDSKVTKENEF